jgi:hypothetical protein
VPTKVTLRVGQHVGWLEITSSIAFRQNSWLSLLASAPSALMAAAQRSHDRCERTD